MRECVRRERAATEMQTAVFAYLLGQGLGVPAEKVTKLLEAFTDELYQTRYTPEAERKQESGGLSSREKAFLDKVARLSEDERR